jgi:hypothetical protein
MVLPTDWDRVYAVFVILCEMGDEDRQFSAAACGESTLSILGEDRPPPLPVRVRRVHRHPVIQLDHRATRITDRTSGFPCDTVRFCGRRRGTRGGRSCVASVLILGRADAICVTAIPRFLRSRR